MMRPMSGRLGVKVITSGKRFLGFLNLRSEQIVSGNSEGP